MFSPAAAYQRLSKITSLLLRHPSITTGCLLLVILGAAAVLAPFLTPYDPLAIDLSSAKMPPNSQHYLGTDEFGRDVFSRLLYSLRVAFVGGFLSVSITAVLGTTLGLLSGYSGGLVDNLIMRFVDMWLSLPGLLFILVIIAVIGRGLLQVLIAIGLAGIPSYARYVRGATIHEKSQLYVEAAQAVGVPATLIAARHIVPNVLPTLGTLIANSFGGAILAAGALSFVKLGGSSSIPELGRMLNDGSDQMRHQWWLVLGPLLVLWLTVLGANLISDGLTE